MHLPPGLRRRRTVDGGAYERVVEADPRADLEQSGGLGRLGHGRPETEALGGAPQQDGIAEGLGRSQQEQQPRLRGDGIEPRAEELAAVPASRAAHGEPADELPRRAGRAQLAQGERVPARLREDPVEHPLVEGEAQHGPEQLARLAVGKALDAQGRYRAELTRDVGVADPEQHGDRLAADASGGERERLRRRPVQPVRIVDHADHRRLLARVGEEREDGHTRA